MLVPEVDLVSSTEANNIVTFVLQASFKNPEVATKEAAGRRPTPDSRLEPGRGPSAPAPR